MVYPHYDLEPYSVTHRWNFEQLEANFEQFEAKMTGHVDWAHQVNLFGCYADRAGLTLCALLPQLRHLPSIAQSGPLGNTLVVLLQPYYNILAQADIKTAGWILNDVNSVNLFHGSKKTPHGCGVCEIGCGGWI